MDNAFTPQSWLTVLVVVALFLVAATAMKQMADRLHRWLERLLGRWLGAWLERNALRFRRTDQSHARFFKHPLGLVLPVLGVNAPLSATMVIETTLILVRALAVPVPAGLGVQDLGYLLSLKALGVPAVTTVGAALVLLKRGKDIFWILAGFAMLGFGRRARAALLGAAA